MSDRPSHVMLALSAGVLASLALADCGGSGSGSGSPLNSASKISDEVLKFTRCLREHGVPVETATSGEGIRITGGGKLTPQKMEAAQHACAKYNPGAAERRKLTPAE